MAKYNRILVKISGEALAGANGYGIDEKAVAEVAAQLVKVAQCGVQVAVVVGGGNFWRGRTGQSTDRVTADQIGMLATVMNALALSEAISQQGVSSFLCSSVAIDKVVSAYNVAEARAQFNGGAIVVFGGGTGAPYFSTDTAAVLRACELHCDALFCSKAVDGIYDSDPKLNPKAKKYDTITYDKIIADNLKVLDLTATAMAREYHLPVVCFGKDEKDGILRILNGEKLGTTIIASPQ